MFLALKELKYAKFRFFMIGMILVLISWLVFVLSGLGNGLSNFSAGSFKTMEAEYAVFEEGSRASLMRSVISEDLTGELKAEGNVEDAAPLGASTVVLLKENAVAEEEKVDAALLGVNSGTFLEPQSVEGDQLPGEGNEAALANITLQEEGIEIGDTLEIESVSKKLEIVGFIENETLFHSPAIFVDMDVWREVQFAAPGSDMGIENPVNAIMLQGEKIAAADLNEGRSEIEVVTRDEAINAVPGYSESSLTIKMMLGFLVVISAFVITVFFYVMTLQKSNQFGIMKAIGANDAFLGKAIVFQIAIVASVSIGIGILLTMGTALTFPESIPFEIDWPLMIIYAIVLLAISVLSSLISVRKIIKIDPLQAMGKVE